MSPVAAIYQSILRCAAVALSPLLLATTGCEATPTGIAIQSELRIRAVTSAGGRLVGAERFDLPLVVEVPAGRFIQAYVLKTPYEETVRPVVPALPMAISQGRMVLRELYFTETPIAGRYPYEVWLINDAGDKSNHIRGEFLVQ